MQVINKKIVIFICLCIFSFVLFKLFSQEKVVLDEVILDIKEPKDSLAIYIEKYDEEGNASYVESDSNTFPLEDYVYNKELSGCLDSNSNEVEDALNYNYVDKELNLRVNKPVTCYVYYDYKGDGTETVPYKIRSIEDLLDLSKKVNEGTTYENKYFELTRDLDFQDINSYNDSERTDYGNINGIADDNDMLIDELTTGTGWIPIGKTVTNRFRGIFDGNNKILKNIYINNNIANNSVGLFGNTANATLKNLTLKGNITTILQANTGIIGDAINTIVENVNNYVNINSLVGGYALGGIIGSAASGNSIIKNCVNYGNITNSNNAGGLVGYNGGSLTIEDSYNEGIITNSLGYHAGGLLGRDNASTDTTTIINSYNNGEVIIDGNDRNTFSGGLIGKLNGDVYINNSYNTGEINANTEASVASVNLGGIIGYTLGKTIITNSYNDANVIGGNRIGGIIGQLSSKTNIVVIDKCYNLGNLSTSKTVTWAGGIVVGAITSYAWNGAQIYVFNSYNAGNLEVNSSSGRRGDVGFVSSIGGDANSNQIVNIVNSYNTGNISGSNIGVGFSRLINGTLKLNNVYSNINFENVTTKYGISEITSGQNYNITKAYYRNKVEDGSTISGSNTTNEEGIIGKNLNEMQSNTFVNDLNNNLSSINILDYIDSNLLAEFKSTTGYDLTLSNWKLKDNHPVLVALEGM